MKLTGRETPEAMQIRVFADVDRIMARTGPSPSAERIISAERAQSVQQGFREVGNGVYVKPDWGMRGVAAGVLALGAFVGYQLVRDSSTLHDLVGR